MGRPRSSTRDVKMQQGKERDAYFQRLRRDAQRQATNRGKPAHQREPNAPTQPS